MAIQGRTVLSQVRLGYKAVTAPGSRAVGRMAKNGGKWNRVLTFFKEHRVLVDRGPIIIMPGEGPLKTKS